MPKKEKYPQFSANARFFVWAWDASDIIWFDHDRKTARCRNGNLWTLEKVLDHTNVGNDWMELKQQSAIVGERFDATPFLQQIADQKALLLDAFTLLDQAEAASETCWWIEQRNALLLKIDPILSRKSDESIDNCGDDAGIGDRPGQRPALEAAGRSAALQEADDGAQGSDRPEDV